MKKINETQIHNNALISSKIDLNLKLIGENELTLTMGFQPLKTVRWSVNGDLLNDNKVVLKPGDNVIRAQVEYLDQSTGYICRTLTVE